MTKTLKALLLPLLYVGSLAVCFFLILNHSRSYKFENACFYTLCAGFWVGLYLIPSFIAGIRNAPNYLIILGINLVFGWTVIVWIAMIIWAVVDKKDKPVVVQQIIYQNNPDSGTSLPPRLPPTN